MKLFSILAVSSVFGEYEDGVYVGDGWVSGGQVVDESGEAIAAAAPQRGLARTGDRSLPGTRRYADLTAMAKRTWRMNGFVKKEKFDERKYWAYGCHCYLLGDRPLSEMGRGIPKVIRELIYNQR